MIRRHTFAKGEDVQKQAQGTTKDLRPDKPTFGCMAVFALWVIDAQ
jgi:hypothetical protein